METTGIASQNRNDLSFKVFFELMARKVTEILLISSPYDAFIMEEDGRLAERIIQEYEGLNLSRPPRVSWVSTAAEALDALSKKHFDFVITMPQVDQVDAFDLGRQIKKHHPNLPVFLMTHNTNTVLIHQLNEKITDRSAIDKVYVWLGNTDLLLALIKSFEDRKNVRHDTRRAMVRVIVMVEDSPYYCSTLLPLLYKELVSQTRALISRSINEEHRLLRMRARPKILVAETYEAAMDLYRRYKPYLLCILSDVRFPRNHRIDPTAGYTFLTEVKEQTPNLPILMFSSDETNRARAEAIPAIFSNKNSPTLHAEIHDFFLKYLGFGEFVFRMPDGREVARANSLRAMEKLLPSIPDESILYHASRHNFSTWLMARAEIRLASEMKKLKVDDFSSPEAIREYLIDVIRARRWRRQRGIISDFTQSNFDPDFEFIKVGGGSLGGKARGLAFMATRLKELDTFQKKYQGIHVHVPKTLVLCTDAFDAFILENNLGNMADTNLADADIVKAFFTARMPQIIRRDVEFLLKHTAYPLAVRSSSLLEDVQFRPCAGLYSTFMLPNDHPDISVRLHHLLRAIKLVYASTYLEAARSCAKTSGVYQTEDEKMAVIIQQLTGSRHGRYFYPYLSGVVQSHNFYPIGQMRPDAGIAHIALGLGKTVVEGFSSLRFSPHHPQYLPQFSGVKDILGTSQRYFYALDMKKLPERILCPDIFRLARLDIEDTKDHAPVRFLSSTYYPEDNRIRDLYDTGGHPVLTFARILKYNEFPLAQLLTDILDIGRQGMGSPVEIEFAMNRCEANVCPTEFCVLQIRPMSMRLYQSQVDIGPEEIRNARLWSKMAMGTAGTHGISHVVYVKPDTFDPAKTVRIASEISRINKGAVKQRQSFLLIGPGRWGSADRWLGIPVVWNDISGARAIVETATRNLKAEPSQGSHFFHNITSLGVGYLTVTSDANGFIDWDWLNALPAQIETDHVRQVRLDPPATLKIDGRRSLGVLMADKRPS